MGKILRIFWITALVLLIFLLAIFLFLFIKSKTWERDFQAEINPEHMVNESLELEDAINEKIEEYILSQEDTDFISFSPREIAQVVHGAISNMVEGSSIEITNTYVEPSVGMWSICGRIRLEDIKRVNPWVCADVTKDSMQTAQLYVTKLKLQGFDIGKIYPKALTRINQGIAEALVTANENGFVGRIFENMELLEKQLIVKGTLY